VNEGVWADRFREDPGKKAGAEEAGDAAEGVDSSLELALLGGADGAGHDGLGGGPGEAHEVEEGDAEPEKEAGTGKAEEEIAEAASEEAEDHGAAFAEVGHGGFDEEDAVERGEDANDGEGDADGPVGPAIAEVGVDDVDVGEGLLGYVAKEEEAGNGNETFGAAEKIKRADRVGAGPGERAAEVTGEGLGEDEEAVAAVDEGESAGDPEGKARVNTAQDAAKSGAEDEADAEGCVEDAEGSGAALAGGDVGEVGEGGGDGGGGEAGDDTADEEPGKRGCESHDDVVGGHAEVGEEDDGPAAEAVGDGPEDGGEEELHGGEERGEDADHLRRGNLVSAEKAGHETGKDGGDHAEGEHVEGDGEEDKGGGGATWGAGGEVGRGECDVVGDELGLSEHGVGLLSRTGVLRGDWHGAADSVAFAKDGAATTKASAEHAKMRDGPQRRVLQERAGLG